MYRLKFIGLRSGSNDPFVRTGSMEDGEEARKVFRELLNDALEFGAFSVFKVSLNSADDLPFRNNILYSQGMSDKANRNTIDLMPQMRKAPIESEQFTLFYFRWSGEYLDRSVTKVDSNILATDLILAFEQDAEKNEYVTTYILLVLDHEQGNMVSHVSYKGLDSLKECMVNGELGGYSWEELEEARTELFGN